MEIKDVIKELRKKRNLSAQQVADGCEMSLGVYKKYESGERGVGVPALQKLADFYNVSVDYLLGRNIGKPEPLDEYAGTVNMSELEREIIDGYFKLDSETRREFMDMLETAVKNVQDGNGEDIYRVAHSKSNHPGEIKKLTKEEKERFDKAAPVTSDNEDF